MSILISLGVKLVEPTLNLKLVLYLRLVFPKEFFKMCKQYNIKMINQNIFYKLFSGYLDPQCIKAKIPFVLAQTFGGDAGTYFNYQEQNELIFDRLIQKGTIKNPELFGTEAFYMHVVSDFRHINWYYRCDSKHSYPDELLKMLAIRDQSYPKQHILKRISEIDKPWAIALIKTIKKKGSFHV